MVYEYGKELESGWTRIRKKAKTRKKLVANNRDRRE